MCTPRPWTDELYARPETDALVLLDLPTTIKGCELTREDIIGGYEIRSRGALGGGHRMRFRALGDTAEIVVIIDEGKLLSTRTLDLPQPRHLDALRALGFTQMTYRTANVTSFAPGRASSGSATRDSRGDTDCEATRRLWLEAAGRNERR